MSSKMKTNPKTKRMSLEKKEDIYKAYKHGGNVRSILNDFKINLKQFKKAMFEIGGEGYNPKVFMRSSK